MKNLMVFSGSCGHVLFIEISDEQWEQFIAPRRLVGSLHTVEEYVPFYRIGRKTRAVYIYPERYMQCMDCIKKDMEEFQ